MAQANFQTDQYAHRLAIICNLAPIDDLQYEPLEFNGNDWTFTLAKKRRQVNMLIKFNGDDLEDST